MKQVAIIGGGLAGLISGILLVKKGVPCLLHEKKSYPQQKVCGEYISNEAAPFLKRNGLYPENFSPAQITSLHITTVRGQSATMPLELGGFAISRFAFDQFLAKKAVETGVDLRTNSEVNGIFFKNDSFLINTAEHTFNADVVIGAFGKRSRLDVKLKRPFILKRSPYMGVKYHVKSDHKGNVIALHNFQGGYCGVVNIENGITNICYLVKTEVFQKYKAITEMEKAVLYQNPHLKNLFENSDFDNRRPTVINEISFETKEAVFDHLLMAGDSAGMITPLCGNGMAMALHSGKIAADVVEQFCKGNLTRRAMERIYTDQWKKLFDRRLRNGRAIQKIYGAPIIAELTVALMKRSSNFASLIIRNTHGDVFL